MLTAVLFDVDGTLVDSNDAHAHAWVAAFAEHGIVIEFMRVRRCIGRGGDKLMPAVSDFEEDSELGTAIAKRRGEIFTNGSCHTSKPFRAQAGSSPSSRVAALPSSRQVLQNERSCSPSSPSRGPTR